MRITISSVSVGDQAHAHRFYTEILGFVTKLDIPLGDARWLTVASPEEPDGVQLLLEPNAEYPAMKALKASLMADGIPFTMFLVKDVYAEYDRLRGLGVEFTMDPTDMGMSVGAIFNDTCGNLVQIYHLKPT
jgi:catechol 2,3-dioxygenase-like lactoylglutathione lyase family enzyme